MYMRCLKKRRAKCSLNMLKSSIITYYLAMIHQRSYFHHLHTKFRVLLHRMLRANFIFGRDQQRIACAIPNLHSHLAGQICTASKIFMPNRQESQTTGSEKGKYLEHLTMIGFTLKYSSRSLRSAMAECRLNYSAITYVKQSIQYFIPRIKFLENETEYPELIMIFNEIVAEQMIECDCNLQGFIFKTKSNPIVWKLDCSFSSENVESAWQLSPTSSPY